jgi:hypothetical protein
MLPTVPKDNVLLGYSGLIQKDQKREYCINKLELIAFKTKQLHINTTIIRYKYYLQQVQ